MPKLFTNAKTNKMEKPKRIELMQRILENKLGEDGLEIMWPIKDKIIKSMDEYGLHMVLCGMTYMKNKFRDGFITGVIMTLSILFFIFVILKILKVL